MTSSVENNLLDDLFMGCAFAAYVELAIACGGIPNSEATRRLAYHHYEQALADSRRCGKDRLRSSPVGCTMCSQKGDA